MFLFLRRRDPPGMDSGWSAIGRTPQLAHARQGLKTKSPQNVKTQLKFMLNFHDKIHSQLQLSFATMNAYICVYLHKGSTI